MTTSKSPRSRKAAARVPKRAAAPAARPVPPAVPTAGASAAPSVNPAEPPVVNPPAESNGVAAGVCLQLESGLEIKDVEGVHRLLLAALADGRAVTVDVGRVQVVDTAGAQLLLAFQGEASRRVVPINFRGESAPLIHTLAVLGLRDKITFAVSHG
jgi:anti-anti-sigma regulatory factor